ncbi:MAG: phage major capsid protein, partial [Clostridia bacterium]|nr:phage major capsid protein [Clostridia bacterium]
MTFDNIRLEKGLYTTGKSFTQALESIDPSENYQGTELEGLDAYQRQLKRFDIKVSGRNSDTIEKFFKTSDCAALFPEYISRAIAQGIQEADLVSKIVATTTNIEGLDYRTIACTPADEELPPVVAEGAEIPETKIATQENLVKLHKRGRILSASYEAIRFQRLDLFTVTLKQIGAAIARAQLSDAIAALMGTDEHNPEPEALNAAGSTLTYGDLVDFWNKFSPYNLTTVIASPDVLSQLLKMSEFRDAYTGLDFHSTGKLVTPFGAELIRYDELPAGRLIAVDKNFALEKVQAGTVTTEFDKLIDRQLERA